MKKVVLLIIAFAMTGCSGKLYTIINPDIAKEKGAKINGVLIYNTINVVEVYKTTTLVDKEGKQIGSEPKDCIPKIQRKASTRTDYNNPNIIVYEPGFLEINTFGVTLDKGVLIGVNTESNPTAALPVMTSLMPYVATAKKNKSDHGIDKPQCNESPILVSVFHAPDILPFDQIDKMENQ